MKGREESVAARLKTAILAITAVPEDDALRFGQDSLAEINSRMKDFWDVAHLLETHSIPDRELLKAMGATFRQRDTPRPPEPAVFDPSFARSEAARTRWRAFLKRSHLPDKEWDKVLDVIRDRLRPLYEILRR